MQTSIAQTAALCIFGNDILQGHSRDNFWPASTVFTFCKFVRFGDDLRVPEAGSFADTPQQWIARLKDEGISGLRLHCTGRNDPGISDRYAVGFAGGGPRWLIEAAHPKTSDLWEGVWQIVDKDAPDQKIWGVTYHRIAQNVARLPLELRPTAEVRADLEAALERIETFATREKLDPFPAAFRNGLNVLSSDTPLERVYHRDIGPNLSREAGQLLGVAQAAWVFGGMGSWNDIGFKGETEKEYEDLSDRLFSLLNEAVCTAANSTLISNGR